MICQVVTGNPILRVCVCVLKRVVGGGVGDREVQTVFPASSSTIWPGVASKMQPGLGFDQSARVWGELAHHGLEPKDKGGSSSLIALPC